MASLFERGIRKLKREALRKTAIVRPPVKAAVIGCGGIAPVHLSGYENTGVARVIAAADVSPAALAKSLGKWPQVNAYRDYRQMLREMKPDVVSVCTWPQHHVEIVADAAAMGVKAILCEKPLALRMDDMDEMIAICQKNGVKFAVGHQFRFHPNFMRAAEAIRAGRLGAVQTVRAAMSGSLANRGPHLIDTVRFLLGDAPAESAHCECHRQGGRFLRGLPEEDSATGEIDFQGGARLELEMGDGHSNVLTISVEGTAGSLEVSSSSYGENGKIRKTPKKEFRPRQFREFIQWAKGKRDSYAADDEQSMKSAELVLALYESAKTGDPVTLPLQNRDSVLEELYAEEKPESAPVESALPDASYSPGRPPQDRLAMDGGARTVKSWFSTGPAIGMKEMIGLAKVVWSKQLSSTAGKVTRQLEEKFARMYGSPHAVASTSGTAALHVALGAVNPEPGDEVITTPMSDMGTVIPILSCNCLPVFADVDAVTGNLTAESIAEKITPRTRAVIVVHLFGRPAEMNAIVRLCSDRGIAVIEDCAQAHFAEYDGKKVGAIGDFGCFSFQSSKQITCGDGGMTLVNSDQYHERAKLYADKGFDRKRPSPTIVFLSPNYRMTELQAAVALAQLKRLKGLIRSRRESADLLTKHLAKIPEVTLPETPESVRCAWWRYTFGIDEQAVGVSTLDFVTALRVEGVKTSKEFPPRPLFEHDMLRDRQTYGQSGYPFTESCRPPELADLPGFCEFASRVVPIGWSSQVKRKHVKSIAAAIRRTVRVLTADRTVSERRAVEVEA